MSIRQYFLKTQNEKLNYNLNLKKNEKLCFIISFLSMRHRFLR